MKTLKPENLSDWASGFCICEKMKAHCNTMKNEIISEK